MGKLKHLKLFEKWERINEEWIPSGPHMFLKDNPEGDVAEFYKIDDDKCGLQFIGGKGDHSKNVLDILMALKDIHYVTDRFVCQGVDDCEVIELIIYKDNLGDSKREKTISKFTKEMEKWGTVTENDQEIAVRLKRSFMIDIPDSEEKLDFKFNKKIDKLYGLLETGHLERTEETEDLIDRLISKIKIRDYGNG